MFTPSYNQLDKSELIRARDRESAREFGRGIRRLGAPHTFCKCRECRFSKIHFFITQYGAGKRTWKKVARSLAVE